MINWRKAKLNKYKQEQEIARILEEVWKINSNIPLSYIRIQQVISKHRRPINLIQLIRKCCNSGGKCGKGKR